MLSKPLIASLGHHGVTYDVKRRLGGKRKVEGIDPRNTYREG